MKKYLFILFLTSFSLLATAQEKAVIPSKITFKEAALIDSFAGPVMLRIGNDITVKKPIPLEFPVPENGNIKKEIKQIDRTNSLQRENIPEPLSPLPAANFNALDDNATSIPPDTKGAAGPNHLMVTLNTQYRIMNKSGVTISTVNAASFWTGVTPDIAGDPHVIYNHYINRWMLIAQSNLNANSSLLVAMSTTNDPTGTWNRYAFDIDATNTDGYDYPLVGFNQNWLVVAANKFLIAGGTFSGTQIHLFNIADLAAGTAITIGTNAQRIINNGNTQGGSISPVTVFETGAPSTTMYTIQAWNGSSAASRLVTLTGTIPTVTWNTASAIFPTGSVTWAGSTASDFTPQLGDTRKINNGDNRPGNFVMVNGKLWWAHHIFLPLAAPTRSAIQWWQIQTNGTILQRGLIDDPTGIIHRTYPSLAINANEDVLIGYSTSSVNRYISAAYSYRMPCNPPNTMQSEVIYKDGLSSYYKTYSSTRNRWGDYSNTCLDPATGDFWTLQEYAGTRVGAADNDSRWGTWWARVAPLTAAAATQVSFDAETLTISELGNTGTCPKYKDYQINFGVNCAANGSATINFSKAGTATNLVDYELLTNTVTYTSGETGSKQLTLRVYDDGTTETNETIILSYTITGTGVVVGTSAQTITITIADDDVAPSNISGSELMLLSENFNSSTSLPSGWATSLVSGGTINQWVVSANAGVDFTGNTAHITNNTTTKDVAYTITSATDNVLLSPNINSTGQSNLVLTFKFKFNGESSFDYGRLFYTLNGTTFIPIEGTSTSPYVGVNTITTRTVQLPAGCNNTNFKLGWRFTCDNSDGVAPPFIIDDIRVVAPSTFISTTVGAAQPVNVSAGTGETYFLSNPGNNLITKIKNFNAGASCLSGSLSESGNGQVTLTTQAGTFQRSSKVISITPANANSTATYEASLYFTNAELAIWGSNKLNLKILKINEGVDLSTTINPNQATLVNPTVIDNSAIGGYVEYKGNFTGFSKFVLVSPATVLPITLLTFDAKIKQKNAELKWKTSQEIDNTGFNIERSTDGVNFKSIGWVNGHGTSNVINDYNFTDDNLQAGIVYYYRLKQIDINNKFSYSQIITLQYNGSFSDVATILPNPIKNVLQIKLNKKVQNIEYSVYDAAGRLITQKSVIDANDIILVNAEKWSKGNYQLTIIMDGTKFSTLFVK